MSSVVGFEAVKFIQFARWIDSGEVVAPSANTELVRYVVGMNRLGYFYGFFVMASEANTFKINWLSGGVSYSLRIPLPNAGVVHYADPIAMNLGRPADALSAITVTNLSAGSPGSVYQVRLLVAEAIG